MQIKLNHIEDKGIYHFELPYGNFIINDKPQQNATYRPLEMTTSVLPSIQEVLRIAALVGYEDADGNFMAVEAYKEALKHLAGYDNDGDMSFDTLEDEYVYKKFVSKYHPKWEHTEELQDVELIVQRVMLDCGSRNITPLFSLDTSKAQLVKLDRLQLQKDTLFQWSKDNNVPVEVPTHSGLKYTKINNKYIFSDTQNGIYYNDSSPVLTLTLEDALAKEKFIKEEIMSILNSVITPVSSLSCIMLIEVQKKLREVQDLAQQGKTKYLPDIIKITKELQQLIKIKDNAE